MEILFKPIIVYNYLLSIILNKNDWYQFQVLLKKISQILIIQIQTAFSNMLGFIAQDVEDRGEIVWVEHIKVLIILR